MVPAPDHEDFCLGIVSTTTIIVMTMYRQVLGNEGIKWYAQN